MAHPLSGANLGTLAAVVRRAGPPKKIASASLIAAAALARWPFSTVERLMIERSLPSADSLAPVFILGHWRSGTTHLYNIMTRGGDWGFVPPVATGLPWDLFGLARAFRPLLERALPAHRYIDNMPVRPDSPQEDEIAIANMSDVSFYHAIYFPRAFTEFLGRGLFFDGCSQEEIESWRRRFAYFLRKLSMHQNGKPLLIKNPVYTGRAALLSQMFPQAKFIHIHRNPYDVFVSMRNFYRKLLAQFALQAYGHVDIDEAILSVYDRMMRAQERDCAGLGKDRYVELDYAALDESPMVALKTIYQGLGIPGFQAAKPTFEAYLASVGGFEKNRFNCPEEAAAKVEARWGRFLDKWGYRRPGPNEGSRHDIASAGVG